MKKNAATTAEWQPRIRVFRAGEIAMGPGKAELLRWIGETGSIREAARRMGMSYMRAWSLVRTMNGSFRDPVVEASRGGKERGGAILTETGARALELYLRMEAQSRRATDASWSDFKALLRG